MSNGKGDTPRPLSVDRETFDNNWDKIFGNKEETCEYSGLPAVTSYEELQEEINKVKEKIEQLVKENERISSEENGEN